MGIVYLIHFDQKIGNPTNPRGQAQHYIGWAKRLGKRLQHHGAGTGAAITRFCASQGIGMEINRAWEGTKDDERSVKNLKLGPRLCLICSAERGQAPIDVPWLDEIDPNELCDMVKGRESSDVHENAKSSDFSKDSWGAQLRQRRKDYGLTQPELARTLNISLSYLEKLESDIMNPSQKVLDDIQSFFPGMPLSPVSVSQNTGRGAIDPTFGREMRAAIKQKGLTVVDFADKLGIGVEQFRMILSGGRRIPYWMLNQVHKILPQMRSVPAPIARVRNKKKVNESPDILMLRGQSDANLARGYGRLGEPKYQGKSLSGQPTWPFVDPDEESVADHACCGTDPCTCDDDTAIGPDDDDLVNDIASRVLARVMVPAGGRPDNFSYFDGSTRMGLGEAGTLTYQQIMTLKPRSARGVPGALDGWSRPPPPVTMAQSGVTPPIDDAALDDDGIASCEDCPEITDLTDLLDPDDDYRDRSGNLRRRQLTPLKHVMW